MNFQLERDAEALAVLGEGFALAFAVENWAVLAELLLHYHHLACRHAVWEVAAQLLGSAAGIGERWDVDINAGQAPHLSITEARRTMLADALGQERYHRLHQNGFEAGFQMSREALQALTSAVGRP